MELNNSNGGTGEETLLIVGNATNIYPLKKQLISTVDPTNKMLKTLAVLANMLYIKK